MQDDAALGHGRFGSDRELEGLVAAFTAGTLPKAAWTHRAHLFAGFVLVSRYGLAAARTLMPAAIKHFNAAVGTADTRTGGYHETITQFYLTVIERFRRTTAAGDMAAQANHLFECWGDRGLPLRYYSESLLWSVEARKRWILPDLAPID
jgi:hypothetical protein